MTLDQGQQPVMDAQVRMLTRFELGLGGLHEELRSGRKGACHVLIHEATIFSRAIDVTSRPP